MMATKLNSFVTEKENKMDWNLAGMMLSLFLLGFAYGAIIHCYVDMVRYRRKWFSRNQEK